jgi:uncharacterized protein YndB with AHSA1/START domain
MSILKIILAGIALIIVLVLIVALFVKKDYLIEREITIDKPSGEVFDYIKYVKNQDHYNKWVMSDPNLKKQFKGTDGTVGFVYAWEGNDKAGKGEQEIKEISEGKKLNLEIRFIKPFEGTAQTEMITQPVSDHQTRVKWRMQGSSKYPMNITNLFTDKILGGDLAESLAGLKGILEK